MKNPMQRFTRFLFRRNKFKAATARTAMAQPHDDDDGNGNQLSGAFVVVLFLHVVAIVGVFAFARINPKKDAVLTPPDQTAAGKPNQAKPNAAKANAAKPPASIAAAAITPVAPAAPAHDSLKASQPGLRTHIVQAGDRLEKIAFAYNVGIPDIVATNHLKNKDDIRGGQALTIPDSKLAAKVSPVPETKPPATTPAAQKSQTSPNDKKTPNTYIVKKGDSAAKIAREHKCTYEELVKLNGIKDPKKIQPGQVLKLPVRNG